MYIGRNYMKIKESIILSMKRVCDYSTRASRTEFWIYQLFGLSFTLGQSLFFCGYFYIATLFDLSGIYSHIFYSFGMVLGVCCFLFGLFNFFVILSLMVRRLHDFNRSGYWLLFINFLYIIALYAFYINGMMLSSSYYIFCILVLFGMYAALSISGDKESNSYGICPL